MTFTGSADTLGGNLNQHRGLCHYMQGKLLKQQCCNSTRGETASEFPSPLFKLLRHFYPLAPFSFSIHLAIFHLGVEIFPITS